MSASSEAALPAPPFRLETFSTPALLGPPGRVGAGIQGPQRLRLALLAVLAASGERGLGRDQLLLLFWPDVSQARARHSLEQLLYAIRSSLDESIFAGGNPLRLNPQVIGSDVAEFGQALDQGQPQAAVRLYRGPFLEGFHLGGSPEFERWVDEERARLERRYMEALERLGQAAEAAGDHVLEVRWRRALAEADPLSSRNAAALIRALANSGDHPGAVRYAEQYEAIVARELETGVDPAVAELVSKLRSGSGIGLRTAPGPALAPRQADPAEPAPAESGDQLPPRVVPPPSAGALPQSGSWLQAPRIAIAGLVLAGAAFAALWLSPVRSDREGPSPDLPSIVVLPLANLSGDPGDAALAAGMTEELIARLAKIERLRVIASTSVFGVEDRPSDVRRLADSLNTSSILEGGLQKVGSRLRVQVRLLDARDGATRWSETYEGEMEDVFSLQDDLARSVAQELNLRLGGHPGTQPARHQTQNIGAYELYLRGRDLTLLRSDSSIRVSIDYFRQAIAADSTYAAAWAGLSWMHTVLAIFRWGAAREELHAVAEAEARKAVALDDSLAEAHAALGFVLMQRMRDFPGAESALKRAIALDAVRSRAREILAWLYLFWTGRPEEGLAEARRALDQDPLSTQANATVADALFANRRYDEALAQLDRFADVRPSLRRAILTRANAYAQKRMWPEAIAELRRFPQDRGAVNFATAQLGHTLARAGQRAEALQILADLRARFDRGDVGAFELAVVYAGLGDLDQAFAWLDKSVDDHSIGAPIMGPPFDDFRRDPRFERVRRRLGLQKR